MCPLVMLSIFIHISHLIGQMRGTSHDSLTPWVGRMWGIDKREGELDQYHNGGEEAHQQGSANRALWLLIAPRSYPQAPWSS